MNDNRIGFGSEMTDRFKAADLLLPYQRAWVVDPARRKFGLMARQVGKDFAAAFEGLADCAEAEAAGQKTDWLIASPSERQSLESLAKWKAWAEVFNLTLADYEETRPDGAESLLQAATITFPHGSRVMAVPGKPETVRGYSANVLLTEFAFFENPAKTWRALFPSLANPMRGGIKKIRIITTPNGIGNMAHDLWVQNFRGENSISNLKFEISNAGANAPAWSCHWVDIHRAVAEGLPMDIEDRKAGMSDPEGWAEEFECQFLDSQSALLTYELIAACESSEATCTVPFEYWQAAPLTPHVMGIDFERKRHLTVAATTKRVGDAQQTVEVLEMDGVSTPEQIEQLRPRIRKARRVCVDYTGPGVGLGDFLAKEFGEYNPERRPRGKIELCHFSNPLKVEIFSKLRMAFEDRRVRVPVSRVLREDLHSVNRVPTATGQVTYRAPYNADGHADRCTALALVLRAAGDARPRGPVIGRREKPFVLDFYRQFGVARIAKGEL